MADRLKGAIRLSAWEMGVDLCHFCEETAVTTWPNQEAEGGPQLIAVCREHAEQLKVPVLSEARATCDYREDESSPPCGAAVTHIVLLGFYVDDVPQIGLFTSCPRHAELPPGS